MTGHALVVVEDAWRKAGLSSAGFAAAGAAEADLERRAIGGRGSGANH